MLNSGSVTGVPVGVSSNITSSKDIVIAGLEVAVGLNTAILGEVDSTLDNFGIGGNTSSENDNIGIKGLTIAQDNLLAGTIVFYGLDSATERKFDSSSFSNLLDTLSNISTENSLEGSASHIDDMDVDVLLEVVLDIAGTFHTNEGSTDKDDILGVLGGGFDLFHLLIVSQDKDVVGLSTLDGRDSWGTTSGDEELVILEGSLSFHADGVTAGVNLVDIDTGLDLDFVFVKE
mmetsp:Transcript_34973/g.31522  ORF Transcript_34973/g.31522 Transcript_34973/m.31522 type:complete len:232 (-) Transcript_34973:783-1478(-)